MQENFPKPPFAEQQQPHPGFSSRMTPQPDHGEASYRGSQRLEGKKTLITGGDSGIGRAVALAFAREGADVAISYLSEEEDAEAVRRLVEDSGRECLLLPGDLADPAHCREVISKTVEAFGRIDVLVNNAAHQSYFESIEEIPDEEWEKTMAVNLSAMFYLTKAAIPHMKPGASIINTASKQADEPSPERGHSELQCGPCAAAGQQGHPGQHGGPRSGVDAARSRHPAAGEGRELRQAGPDGAPGTAQGTRTRLRHAGQR
jgi:NAD(P)-dependent dehydrogenase (short-subunit alcohol dehydrogenase family)